MGRELLEAQLSGCLQPVFTPPWNRCTDVTAELLSQIGVTTLSRHVGSAELRSLAVAEMPVSIDWSYAKRDGRRLTAVELAELAAEQVRRGVEVGINLHHAVMDVAELRRLEELCRLLAGHPAARCRPLAELSA
jgi:hypothetical protein